METTVKIHKQSITSAIAASLLLLSLAAGSSQARAAEDAIIGVQKIHYGDLNLDTEAGARVLYQRLRHAANNVCRPSDSLAEVVKANYPRCYEKALNSAVASLNKPLLTALHNQRALIQPSLVGSRQSSPPSAQPLGRP
jgi:UrcA family protein